jgi:hypothetical protein
VWLIPDHPVVQFPLNQHIDAVRDELAGKAIVYNLCRTIMLRRKAKELPEKEAEAA